MTKRYRQSKAAGIAISISAYIVAFFIAAAAVRYFQPGHILTTLVVGDVAATLAIFLLSVAFNNSSLYDPYWSLKPAVIAGYYLWLAGPVAGTREIVVSVLVFLYALRLTSNFYRDWPGLEKEDFRYVNFRRQFPKAYWLVSLGAVHFFPTVMVFLGCIPLYAIHFSDAVPMNAIDLLATAVLLGAVLLAFTADEQLRRFRDRPANKGKVIDKGLWKYSRHPNYLGEISTWWGLYLFALASGVQWWWTGAGAVAITVLFVFASIPLMEKRMKETRPGYEEYMKRTPMLISFGTKK